MDLEARINAVTPEGWRIGAKFCHAYDNCVRLGRKRGARNWRRLMYWHGVQGRWARKIRRDFP